MTEPFFLASSSLKYMASFLKISQPGILICIWICVQDITLSIKMYSYSVTCLLAISTGHTQSVWETFIIVDEQKELIYSVIRKLHMLCEFLQNKLNTLLNWLLLLSSLICRLWPEKDFNCKEDSMYPPFMWLYRHDGK